MKACRYTGISALFLVLIVLAPSTHSQLLEKAKIQFQCLVNSGFDSCQSVQKHRRPCVLHLNRVKAFLLEENGCLECQGIVPFLGYDMYQMSEGWLGYDVSSFNHVLVMYILWTRPSSRIAQENHAPPIRKPNSPLGCPRKTAASMPWKVVVCSIYGCFLKWWYPQNTPKWSFLVGKPMVVGYHHFRKHPYFNIAFR